LATFSRFRIFRDHTGIGYFGLHKIDRKISKYLKNKKGFYIEIGANDGIKQSNTLVLEKYLGWHGVLIEPHPETFLELCKNRKSSNFFANAACVDFGYPEPSVELNYSGLMTIQMNLEISDPNYHGHSRQGRNYLGSQEVYSFSAKALSLASILKEAGAPSIIDFFSLDVEGAELQVLEGIDHLHYRFQVILVETKQISEIERYLNSNSYKMMEKVSHHDYIFINQLSGDF
jgi:FkbM family methyltransferase